jgi:hypothetical protein
VLALRRLVLRLGETVSRLRGTLGQGGPHCTGNNTDEKG